MGRATGKNNQDLGALELIKGLYETLGGAARGVTSATLGMPGDLEGLIRVLTPGVSNEPLLPNTESVMRHLPGPDNTMSELGRNMPLTPTQATRLMRPVGKLAAEGIHRGMMGQGPLKGALSAIQPQYVVKERGGNWLPGSSRHNIENVISGELRTNGIGEEEFMNLYRNDPNHLNDARKGYENAKVMDQWMKGPLQKYIMRDMATENDPIRKLADQGILHVDPQELNFNMSSYGKFPLEGQRFLAKSDMAKAWEGVTDNSIGTTPRWQLSPEPGSSRISREHPWIDKLPEETPFHSITEPGNFMDDTGLDRLSSRVYESLIDGELRPEQLQSGSFGVEAAVRHAHQKRMAELAAKEAEDLKNSRNAAVSIHKEYPGENNPDGFHWVEIKKPNAQGQVIPRGKLDQEAMDLIDAQASREALDKGLKPGTTKYDRFMEDRVEELDIQRMMQMQREQNLSLESGSVADLQRALNYEGDAMGHCVGDYCEGVLNGTQRIFSLRDKSGKPHVTIEAAKDTRVLTDEEKMFYDEFGRTPLSFDELKSWGDKNDIPIYEDSISKAGDFYMINQIKGSGKKDSVQRITAEDLPKYQPYLQDFLHSGDWGRIRDLPNTGLRDMKDLYGDKLPKGAKRFMTAEEQQLFNNRYPDVKSRMSEEIDNMGDWEPDDHIEFARGGLVEPPDYFEDLDAFLAR